jgi:adenosine kinase
MEERTGKTMEQLAEMVEAVIVTRGGEGSYIYTQGQRLEIPVAKPEALVDPTGCGDAYRGGLLFGLMKGYDWEITARIASLMGAYKIESQGPQNHSFSMDEFAARFEAAFGMSLPS